MTRVLIVDDQAMVRAGFRWLLESETDIEVIGEAGNGREAVELVRTDPPDVVLMDIRMPVLDGIEATVQISREAPRTRVLVLTTYDLDEYVYAALSAGASGFLLKDAPADQLAGAIRVIAQGNSLFAPAVTKRVIDEFVRHTPSAGTPAALERLTPREREIFDLLAQGLSNPEICAQLYVSEATTKTHVGNVLAKLGLRDRVQVVIYAYEHGVVAPGSPPIG